MLVNSQSLRPAPPSPEESTASLVSRLREVVQAARLSWIRGNERQRRQEKDRILVAERAGKAVGHGELAFGDGLQLFARLESGFRIGLGRDDERNGTKLRVRIVGANIDVRSTATTESLRTTRERLQALYGDNASLDIEAVGGGDPEIVLQIPFER